MTTPNAPARKSYEVLGRLKHNGKVLVRGGTVELTEAEAETLEALGVIGEPAEDVNIKKDKGGKSAV